MVPELRMLRLPLVARWKIATLAELLLAMRPSFATVRFSKVALTAMVAPPLLFSIVPLFWRMAVCVKLLPVSSMARLP
jgi:hypothetical protein